MSDASTRSAALGVTLAMHALALGVLLAYAPAREARMNSVITVDFIAPPRAEPRLARPAESPEPRPVAKRAPHVPEPAPIISAPAEAPPVIAAAHPARPAAPSAPELAATPLAPAAAASASEAAPASTTAPVFDADYLENPPPLYPAPSRRLGEQGRVVLRVLVNPAGRATEVQLHTSSGHARLDETAREIVRRWKFVPARRGSEAVAAWVLIPISFRLEG